MGGTLEFPNSRKESNNTLITQYIRIPAGPEEDQNLNLQKTLPKSSSSKPTNKRLRRRWTNSEREAKTSIGIQVQSSKDILNFRYILKTKIIQQKEPKTSIYVPTRKNPFKTVVYALNE